MAEKVKDVEVGSNLAEFVQKEISKLEQKEARLQSSCNSLQKEINTLTGRRDNLKNEIYGKIADADKEIDKKKEGVKELEEKARESLNQTKALEGRADSLKQDLKKKTDEADTTLNNLGISRSKLDKEKEDFEAKKNKLNEIKAIIEGL